MEDQKQKAQNKWKETEIEGENKQQENNFSDTIFPGTLHTGLKKSSIHWCHWTSKYAVHLCKAFTEFQWAC